MSATSFTLGKFERLELNKSLSTVSGDSLLQLGGSDPVIVQGISLHAFINENNSDCVGSNSVVADFSMLPIRAESIDCVLLIHAHELVSDPYVLFKESYRVLKPEGRLIILGHNAWGLHYCYRRGNGIYSPMKIQRWLRELEFTFLSQKIFGFVPEAKWLPDYCANFFEALGRLCLIPFGNFYLIDVQKKVYGVHALEEVKNWFVRQQISNRQVKPTARN